MNIIVEEDTSPSSHYPSAATPMMLTTLLHTHIWSLLPTSTHHAYVCSAGSQGYHALKEMLQNGKPGHTLLLESGDLREVGLGSSEKEEAEGERCSLLYTCWDGETVGKDYRNHIPLSVTHLIVYGNVTHTPVDFLCECIGLATLDLGPLSQVTTVGEGFLNGCSSVTALDLSPLSQVTEIQEFFLLRCAGLNTLDLRPLSRVTVVRGCFICDCTGLTALDLSPLSQVTELHEWFLAGCSGLKTLDLSSLSQVTEVHRYVLNGCSSLTALDLSPLSGLVKVHGGLLAECPQLNFVHNVPSSCTCPPHPWTVVPTTNHWIRREY